MKRYPIRAIKSLVMFFALAALVFVLGYYLGGVQKKHPDITFWAFAQMSNLKQMILFLGAFGLIYPLVGFVNKKIYTNGPLTAAQKQQIEAMFAAAKYVLTKDENNVMVFRPKASYVRFMRLLFEDSIRLDYSDNPLVMDGLRRDVYRLARNIEISFRREENAE